MCALEAGGAGELGPACAAEAARLGAGGGAGVADLAALARAGERGSEEQQWQNPVAHAGESSAI